MPSDVPFLQRDVLAVMERKAIARPSTGQPQLSLSARPHMLRPRSANQEEEQQRPRTSEDSRKRVGGYIFPTAAKPSPRAEALAAASSPRRQPLSALEASHRKKIGMAVADTPSVDALLPPLSCLPFQPNAALWFQSECGPASAALAGAPTVTDAHQPPPPQRPPSAQTSFADVGCVECFGCASLGVCGASAATGGSYANGATRPRSSSVSAEPPLGAPSASADAAGGGAHARAMSPERERAREQARRNGMPDHATAEAVAAAVEERTAILTRIFQERLAKQRGALETIRESEKRAHEGEVRSLKGAFEERLTEAVEKVRAVHATNRDAVAILQKNKKLRLEVNKLKHEMHAAQEAQRDAAQRERQKAEEGAAVVQQLMNQLQEKEALLAMGAGGMSEEEREEMVQKERQRAAQAADKEKKRIEAAMAEERARSEEKLTSIQTELANTKRQLGDAREELDEKVRQLDKESRAHAKTTVAREKLEAMWKAEEAKRERVTKLEHVVKAATRQISAALFELRDFLQRTDQHFKVDLECLMCLQPMIEPQVLVPCGHSVCLDCSQALDRQGAASGAFGGGKFCPLCAQIKEEEEPSPRDRRSRYAEPEEEEEGAPPVEQFPNLMLDAVTTRLRAKSQNVQGLVNFVAAIFDKGGNPLPHADMLAGPEDAPYKSAAAAKEFAAAPAPG